VGKVVQVAVLAIALSVALITDLRSQDNRPDPIRLLPDGKALRIERIEEIPRQLMTAIQRTGCRLRDYFVQEFGVQIFKPGLSRPVALVPCIDIVGYTLAFRFDHLGREPSLMHFPVITIPDGITVSERVGMMEWSPETRILHARQRTDVCPSPELRYAYSLRPSGQHTFALTKIEHRPKACGQEHEWRTMWESPPWPSYPN